MSLNKRKITRCNIRPTKRKYIQRPIMRIVLFSTKVGLLVFLDTNTEINQIQNLNEPISHRAYNLYSQYRKMSQNEKNNKIIYQTNKKNIQRPIMRIVLLMTIVGSLVYFFKTSKAFFIFISFCAVAIGPKNIKTFFLVLELLVGNQIYFFLNNFKSTATMVKSTFKFILSNILNKIIFGK